MIRKKILSGLIFVSIAIFVCGLVQNISAQLSGGNDDVARALDAMRQKEETAHSRDQKRNLYTPPHIKAKMIAEWETNALRGRRDRILPAASYFTQYAEFLRDDKSGLARIFPDQKCDEGKVIEAADLERCAGVIPLRGGGSFYSFRNRSNLNDDMTWADVHYVDGKFLTGSETEFGVIGEVGDIALESLTLKSKELAFLKDYKPKNRLSQIKAENESFMQGLTVNGLTYSLSVPIKVNSTYILRSVAYELEDFNPVDSRVDIIVAFKVVSRENDGSLILLWKELRRIAARPLKKA